MKNYNESIKLLKACVQLLEKQENSCYILDLLYETVHYDDADCDGSCLLDDIKMFLEELKDE